MLLLLLLFFMGKWLFDLAKKHNRNKWVFGILGVVVFYIMTLVGGIVIVLIAMAAGSEGILQWSDTVLGLLGIPVGILSVWGLHTMLRKTWSNNPTDNDTELLDTTTEF